MSRLTFFWCRDFLDGRDWLFFSRSRFLKSRLFSLDLDVSRFLSRSSRQIETVEIYRDFQDLSRIFTISRHNWDFFKTFSRLQAQKSRQIEKSRSSNVITLTNSRSRSRQTVKIYQKCHVSTDFSVLIEAFRTFWTFRTCRDKIKISQSWLSRLTFWNCQDFLDRWDWPFFGIEIAIFSTIETDPFLASRQIETPKAKLMPSNFQVHVLKLSRKAWKGHNSNSVQWKPLNRITLGQWQTYSYNWVIIISEWASTYIRYERVERVIWDLVSLDKFVSIHLLIR